MNLGTNWREAEPQTDSGFRVHVVGPDEYWPAESWLDACELAHDMNAVFINQRRRAAVGAPYAWATPEKVNA